MKSKKQNPFGLTDFEIEAIICALSTIDYFPCESSQQMDVNLRCRDFAKHKLSSRFSSYTPNEIRIISCAIDGAILYLAGQYPEVKLDAALEKEIMKNLFVYNRLSPHFQERMNRERRKFL